MQKNIESILNVRKYLLEQLKELDEEQLNKVPEGFNNNIIWNIAHMVASQQGICYRRANLPLRIDESFFERYKPGTMPADVLTKNEIENIKGLLLSTIEELSADYNKGVFNSYGTWTSRYGVELSNIDEAIDFLIFHEGLHTGTVQAMRKLVNK